MTTASKSAVTAVAAAMAAVLCTQMAYAAGEASGITPTAVWSRNLGQSYTIDGKTYKFSIYDGVSAINQDGTLTVANAWTGYPSPYIDISADGATSVSVLVKFSGLSLPVTSDYGVCIADMVDSDNIDVGTYVAKGETYLSAFHMVGNSPTQACLNNTDHAVIESGYMLYSYSTTGGVKAYMGSSIDALVGGQNAGYKFGGRTISRVAVGGEAKAKYYEPSGITIEAVALFVNEFYTASDVASYEFPAKIYSSDVNVSTINNDFSGASEIDVYLADGVTVTGDTTFTATKVNFHCYGSFNMTPPANNEAVFDFSDVGGSPVIIYNGATPTVSGSKFTSNVIPSFVVTESTQWTGTIWIKNVGVSNFAPSNFGNANSTVRLSGVWGHFAQGSVSCAPAIELVNDSYDYGFYVSDGYSRSDRTPNNVVVISKLKGNGDLWTGSNGPTVLMQVLDWSEYSGAIQLVNKIVVFGSYLPPIAEFNTAGGIYIGTNETVEVTSGKEWRADGKVHVYGTFKTTALSQLKSAVENSNPATIVHTYDSGTFVLTTNSNTDDLDVDYSKIEGTGTLRYEGTAWRTISRSNYPTTMTVENNLSSNGLLHMVPNAEFSIGSLSGNGRMRSDWGGSGNTGDRDLRILQSKDTTYTGLFDYEIDRINNVIVAPGASSAGTLTITGEQRANNNLVVESGAKVNLTGTWVGATTVAGTLGGTGAITGDLTLSDGATLKVNDINDTLDVTGAFTASSGTVTVDLPAGTSTQSGVKIISATGTITTGAKFNVTIGGVKTSLRVITKSDGLKAVLPGLKIILR